MEVKMRIAINLKFNGTCEKALIQKLLNNKTP